MVDELVRNLATRVGVSTNWRDQTGEDRIVSIDTLRHILISLGYPAENEGDVRNALSALDAGVNMQSAQSHFVTARVGQPVALPVQAEPGTTVEVTYNPARRASCPPSTRSRARSRCRRSTSPAITACISPPAPTPSRPRRSAASPSSISTKAGPVGAPRRRSIRCARKPTAAPAISAASPS